MARRLLNDQAIDAFIAKVLGEANHHASGVAATITPLSNAVRARLNLALDKVEVIERNGNLGRTCWVTIGGNRYAFTYNYRSHQIDLKKTSTQGVKIFSFDNNTSAAAILTQASVL